MSKRLYVVAGELSGDAHGAGFLRALKTMVPALEIHITAILGMLFLAACGKPSDQETATIPAHGHKLADLVYAANAPVFDTGGVDYVEAVWIDGVWKIHDDGVWIADGTDEDGIYETMKGIGDKRQDFRILISAEKKTAFGEIVTMIRGAASAGFTDINFLVASDSPKPQTHAFPLELPTLDERLIDPAVIQLDAYGAVYSGSGTSYHLLDPATAEPSLPGLNSELEIYAAAAEAVRQQMLCLIHIEPAVIYQRAIGLISRFHEHRVFMRFTNFRIERDKHPKKPNPRPPNGQAKSRTRDKVEDFIRRP